MMRITIFLLLFVIGCASAGMQSDQASVGIGRRTATDVHAGGDVSITSDDLASYSTYAYGGLVGLLVIYIVLDMIRDGFREVLLRRRNGNKQ